ncbi:hypothetical protein R3P38DRAFT_2899081 [Favolaschia claudopus]|uniref:Uncharacterized protein n=1 Tax=Favolaschia claudopus TaxID=2862362 RepID=A0AAW0CJB3_9AGAR
MNSNPSDPDFGSTMFTDSAPMTWPADAFSYSLVDGCERVPVTKADIRGYKQDPDRLLGLTFISRSEDGDEELEAFQLAARYLSKQKTVFYVVFADDGPEAVYYGEKEFYEMLETAALVKVPEEEKNEGEA